MMTRICDINIYGFSLFVCVERERECVFSQVSFIPFVSLTVYSFTLRVNRLYSTSLYACIYIYLNILYNKHNGFWGATSDLSNSNEKPLTAFTGQVRIRKTSKVARGREIKHLRCHPALTTHLYIICTFLAGRVCTFD